MTSHDAFEIGKLYFTVYYMDDHLRIPVVESLVYLGPETIEGESGDEPGYLFQYAASFYREGNWKEISEEERYEFEEPPIMAFPQEYKEHIVDLNGLIAELEELREKA